MTTTPQQPSDASCNSPTESTSLGRKPNKPRLNMFSLLLAVLYLVPFALWLDWGASKANGQQIGYQIGSGLLPVFFCWLLALAAYYGFRRSNRAYNVVFIVLLILALLRRMGAQIPKQNCLIQGTATSSHAVP